MPKYIISSDAPITATALPGLHPDHSLPWPERPVDPGYGIEEGSPEHPWVPPSVGIWPSPGRPAHPWIPPLPEWPPLPPGIALPIPPTPEHPIAPLPPDEAVDPPTVWPPIRPEFPDLSGKTLVLALIFVSRHEPVWRWVVVDHEEAKDKLKEIWQKIKDRPRPEHPIAPGAQPKA